VHCARRTSVGWWLQACVHPTRQPPASRHRSCAEEAVDASTQSISASACLRPRRHPAAQAARIANAAGLDPSAVIPSACTEPEPAAALHRRGFSKFVLRPAETPQSWPTELEQLAEGSIAPNLN